MTDFRNAINETILCWRRCILWQTRAEN